MSTFTMKSIGDGLTPLLKQFQTNIEFGSTYVNYEEDIPKIIQKISIPLNSVDSYIQPLRNSIESFSSVEYYNCSLNYNYFLNKKYNYNSPGYQEVIRGVNEILLPNFYIEYPNDQNQKYSNLRAFETQNINENFYKSLAKRTIVIRQRPSSGLKKFENILFNNDFNFLRSKNFNEIVPYYSNVSVLNENPRILSPFLEEIGFSKEFLGGITSNALSEDIDVENAVYKAIDVFEMVRNNNFKIGIQETLVLGNSEIDNSHISTSFKKLMLTGFFNSKVNGIVKNYKQIFDNEDCHAEVLYYKIEKRTQNAGGVPIQNFWLFGKEGFLEYHDTQVHKNETYHYTIKAKILVYGANYTIENLKEENNEMKFDMVSRPAFKILDVHLGQGAISIVPKLPMTPYVKFVNESNSENRIKIYLSLKYGDEKKGFTPLTNKDGEMISRQKISMQNTYDFKYIKESGKFEVFRHDVRPESYSDFSTKKVFDVKNKRPSTSVVFHDDVIPNKKYYYSFRAINTVGAPSNPSPVYEVELIKEADESRIVVSVVNLKKDTTYYDKTFKRLLQIKPAFLQEIFDDESEFVENLPSFKGHVDDISLGINTHKVWGRKLKIRIKSKDTGKIIDFNVKFTITKNKTIEDL